MPALYVKTDTDFREATREETIARAQSFISQRFRHGAKPLTNPELTKQFLRLHLGALDHEVFGILHLDESHRLIEAEELFRGTIGTVTVHVREVLLSVLKHRASAIILYHNHPSGIAEPSHPDRLITAAIIEALLFIDVKVLDHLIVGKTFFSFADEGLLL